MNNNINLIVAMCKNNGIGFNNTLPWKISSDLKKFKKLTLGNGNNAIIMGKNTYLSINKHLPKRDNIVLSSQLSLNSNNGENNILQSFENIEMLQEFLKIKTYDEIWIIGGTQIYDLFLNNETFNELFINKIYITYIDKEFECDTFFPTINTKNFRFISQEIHKTENEELQHNIFDRLYVNNK